MASVGSFWWCYSCGCIKGCPEGRMIVSGLWKKMHLLQALQSPKDCEQIKVDLLMQTLKYFNQIHLVEIKEMCEQLSITVTLQHGAKKTRTVLSQFVVLRQLTEALPELTLSVYAGR